MDLDSSVAGLRFVGPKYEFRLAKLGIGKVRDLLYHVPSRYLDFRKTTRIDNVHIGDIATIKGRIIAIKNQYTRYGKQIQFATIDDGTGSLLAVWFNQMYLVKALPEGTEIALAGKVDSFGGKLAMISPEHEKQTDGKAELHTGRLVPVYPETSGVSSKWLRERIYESFKEAVPGAPELIPSKYLKRLRLIKFKDAVNYVHYPGNLEEAKAGKKRLAFDEILFMQLGNSKRKSYLKKTKASVKLNISDKAVKRFISSLPFNLTASQKKAVGEILADLKNPYPMNRLLEGDVGSGKTVVAAVAAWAAFADGAQTVIMAPTQILAQQHFTTLTSLLEPFKVRIKLISAGIKAGDIGRTDVFIGTHALMHKKVSFDKVGLVVIDEQHRFGVEQRTHLVKKAGTKTYAPHVLTMTATPIPRTVAMTAYGDMDLSTLDELPAGRQKIATWVVPPQKRAKAYGWMKKKLVKEQVQAFVVCPLIEESGMETMKQVKAATKEYEELKKIFPGIHIGLLHGRQKAQVKNAVLAQFKSGGYQILVATPVVEVGIDVPNATIMVIEGAERFGLSQLHQLRGRVGRGEEKSYCLLFTDSSSPKAVSRLTALEKGITGFELAELDLSLRGPGEIFGLRQHGFHELKVASWQDTELIKQAKAFAEEIFAHPEEFPLLRQRLALE